jgi:hypothetical protein
MGDLVVEIDDICTDLCDDGLLSVWLHVANRGMQGISDPITVDLIAILPDGAQVVGSTVITNIVPPGTKLGAVQIDIDGAALGIDVTEITEFLAAVDGGGQTALGTISECHEDNNESIWGQGICN